MNDIIKLVFTRGIQLISLIIVFYLMMDLFSNRAIITLKRIRIYIVYAIMTYIATYVLVGAQTSVEFIFYTAVVVVCCLFEEEHLLTKIWKVVLVICMQNILEIGVTFIGDWFYYNVWTSWIVYEFGVGLMCDMIMFSVVIINKKLKLFTKVRVESIIFSRAEAILLCILAFCAIYAISVASLLYDYRDVMGINNIGKTVLWAYMTVLSTTCLVLGVDRNIAQNYYKRVNELIEKQFSNQVKYYEKIEESNKEIRAIKHDMKNHLISMQSLLHDNQLIELDKYIEDIRTTISKKVVLIKTGNTIIDAILNEKNAVAHEKNIVMDIKVGIEEYIDIELIDLCIILSNSIDNAIEACERVEDVAKRKISIKCSYRAGYFWYAITNTMKEEAISGIKGKLRTIKKDKKNHGFGLGNIKQSVKKYGGEVRTSAENFEFKLEVEINTKATISLQA